MTFCIVQGHMVHIGAFINEIEFPFFIFSKDQGGSWRFVIWCAITRSLLDM